MKKKQEPLLDYRHPIAWKVVTLYFRYGSYCPGTATCPNKAWGDECLNVVLDDFGRNPKWTHIYGRSVREQEYQVLKLAVIEDMHGDRHLVPMARNQKAFDRMLETVCATTGSQIFDTVQEALDAVKEVKS